MFTSGSTGQLKGVILEHRSLSSSFTALSIVVGWTCGTRVLQFAAPAWDACVLETLGPLLADGCVCIPSTEKRESALVDYINSAKVNFATQTPTALRNLTPEAVLLSLKGLMSAGEPIPRDAPNTWGSKLRLLMGPVRDFDLFDYRGAQSHVSLFGHGWDVGGSTVWVVNTEDPKELLPIGAVRCFLALGLSFPLWIQEQQESPSATTRATGGTSITRYPLTLCGQWAGLQL